MANIKDKLDQYLDKRISEDKLEDIFGDRFGKYTKEVIQDRAIPDARDGLKPVQRRIIYGLHKMHIYSDSQTKKCARIVGEVMGKYHPHGDSSIYEALVRMSQDWKTNMPLAYIQGNNGSMDGDSPAAMRYTEAKMTKAAELLIENIDKKTVDFVPNYDDTEVEPVVLPAKFPNLLVNGSTGMAVGYATEIPPHNLKEVLDATIALIDNPELTNEDLEKFVIGPDFPTGGIVQGLDGLKQAYETGKGKIVLRGKADIELDSKSNRIVITELPYDVNKKDLVIRIKNIGLIEKKVDGITDVLDLTDKNGLKIVVELKKEAKPDLVLNYLFKNTDLQTTYNYNMVAIYNRKPVLMDLKSILEAYLNHQKEVITNRSNFDLFVAKKRLHICEGLIKMTSILDQVIDVIRHSNGKADSKVNLIEKFGFSEEQAEAIVTLQLYRLSKTDVEELRKEVDQLKETISYLESVLSSERKLLSVIKKELNEVAKLSNERRTKIEDEIQNIKISEEELVTDEQIVVGVTKDGYIKRASIRSYNQATVCGLKENDALIYREEISTLNTLLIFTSLGNYIYLPAYKIDEQKWKDLGVYIDNIVHIMPNEKIVNVFAIKDFNEDYNVLITTRLGLIKQTKLADFNISRYTKAVRAMKLQDKDLVVSVDIARNYPMIVVFNKRGKALRFRSNEVTIVGTQAGGVRAMNSTCDVACAIYTRNNHDILILTSRGNVKRIKSSDLKLSSRARSGEEVIKEVKSNPNYIVDAHTLSYAQYRDNVDLYITTTKTSLNLKAFDFKYNDNKVGTNVVPQEMGEPLKINLERHDEIEIFDDEIEIQEVNEDDFDGMKQISIFDEFEE